jgi:hypothetical protein
MPALVAGIYVFTAAERKDVGGRDKPGHDGGLEAKKVRRQRRP